MSKQLTGKVAFVTGAARGQGAAIARIFVREGAKVVLADVSDEAGRTVVEDLRDNAIYLHLDVSEEEQWKSAVARTEEVFGGLDILVNNAGISQNAAIEDMSIEEYQRIISVNQVGCWLGMRQALPCMRKRSGGSIINTASSAGLVPVANRSAYVASKFAVRGMSKAAALEFGRDNVRVNTIFPGAIDTPINDNAALAGLVQGLPISRMGTVDDIAELTLFLASNKSSYITGAEIVIDGGMLAGFKLNN